MSWKSTAVMLYHEAGRDETGPDVQIPAMNEE